MKITINNKNDVNVYSFHDCDFKEMNYKYLEESIQFLLYDRYENIIYSLYFEKVIYYDMQSFHMWINMPTDIHGWGLCENDILYKLYNLYETQKIKFGSIQPIHKLKEYIGVTFEFVSGDELTIICKSIEIVEQDMGELKTLDHHIPISPK